MVTTNPDFDAFTSETFKDFFARKLSTGTNYEFKLIEEWIT